MSRSAVVKAAPTSVDGFSQAGASGTKGDEPSRAEVQQRITNLYDRVENATGNFNATRAMSRTPRDSSRATRDSSGPASGGRPGRGGATDAPAAPLSDVAKQWFDVGRAQLGPAFPAVLPPDRMPDRGSAGSRPADSGGRSGGRGRETADKPVLELTAGPSAGGSGGPVAELTARPVAELTAGPVAELTAGPVAALPAVPAQRQAADRALPGQATEPSQASLKSRKQRNQRKLGQARELLAGHIARRSAPVAELESRPAEAAWRPAAEQTYPRTGMDSWQQPAIGRGTEPYTGGAPYVATAPYDELPTYAAVDMRAGTDMRAGADMYPGSGTYPGPDARVTAAPNPGSGMYVGTDQYAGTGFYGDASTPIAAGVAADMQAMSNPGYVSAGYTGPGYANPGYTDPGYVNPDPGYGGKGARAVDFARAQIGKPCVWGAMGPGSYDCSSLIQAAWKVAGVALPRSVQEQATAGTMVSVSDIRPGDLVLFSGPVGHVGVYTANGMMIHAPSPGAAIREESIYWAGEPAIHSVIRPA
ncbi:NlpC/P60 family protein [Streptomyces sp. NPDC048484]|uniref:C40 family peptidase n=1 Tax=Streptomyces sp. NPDC048484 TaxID=3155146 RepID=UPI003418E455